MSDDTGEVELHLPTLRKGANPTTGPTAIMRLQHILNDRNVGPLVEDGEFGPKTDAAVKSYQELAGLTADGVVGPLTWTDLLNTWLLFSEPG